MPQKSDQSNPADKTVHRSLGPVFLSQYQNTGQDALLQMKETCDTRTKHPACL